MFHLFSIPLPKDHPSQFSDSTASQASCWPWSMAPSAPPERRTPWVCGLWTRRRRLKNPSWGTGVTGNPWGLIHRKDPLVVFWQVNFFMFFLFVFYLFFFFEKSTLCESGGVTTLRITGFWHASWFPTVSHRFFFHYGVFFFFRGYFQSSSS